jgi:signal transduction histidine kinase
LSEEAVCEPIMSRRVDGRSNQEVLVDYAIAASQDRPDHVFTYGDLSKALGVGVDRMFSREDVQQVVRLAKPLMLTLHKRTFTNMPNVGYRLARASDHQAIAKAHTRRASRQVRHALLTMENARVDELTDAERELHNAQLTINRRLYEEQRRIVARQQRQDDLIAQLASRVDQLEADRAAG